MRITDIKIYHLNHLDKENKCSSKSSVKAFATVVFDDELVIRDFRIIETEKGLFVGMPCRKTSEGKWVDIVFPISMSFAKTLQNYLLKAYKDELETLVK